MNAAAREARSTLAAVSLGTMLSFAALVLFAAGYLGPWGTEVDASAAPSAGRALDHAVGGFRALLLDVAFVGSALAALGFMRGRRALAENGSGIAALAGFLAVLAILLRTASVDAPLGWGFWCLLAGSVGILAAALTLPGATLSKYVTRRLLLSIPVLLGVTLITFSIAWAANEGHMERGYLTEKMTPIQRERIVEQYGFDEPFHIQYFNYVERLAKLDLGVSHSQGDRAILDVYGAFFPATIELTMVAMIIAVIGGVFLGTLSAMKKDAPVDHATRFLALAGVSVPIFWLGLLLKFAFATEYPVTLFTEAGWITKGVVLSVAYLIPIMAGLFLAESFDPRQVTWIKLGVQAAILAALVWLAMSMDWTFFGYLLMLIGGVAIAVVAALVVMKLRRMPPMMWRAILGGTVAVAFAFALSPMANGAVAAVFDVIPTFPLGGRFPNDLVIDPDAHPSITSGPTSFLLVDTALAGDWEAFNAVMLHLILPAITLGYASLAIIARMMRSSMLETLGLDFVRTARAKGLPESIVIARHARRNALIPIATVVGLTFGGLLSGAVLTETIFQWPGLGRWSTQAIVNSDTNSVMNFTLLVVVIYLIANLIVDIMYSVLDPRVRLG